MISKFISSCLVFSVIFTIGAFGLCAGGSRNATSTPSDGGLANALNISSHDENGVPIVISLDSPPQRIVASNQSSLEVLMALGVADRVVGWCWPDNDRWPSFADLYEGIPLLSEKYPSVEALLAQRPDFVVGWKSFFKQVISSDDLAERNIGSYVRINSGIGAWPRTMDGEFEDIRKIGVIMGVEEKAEQLVRTMEERKSAIVAAVKKRRRDSLEEPLTVIAAGVSSAGNYTIYGSDELIGDMICQTGMVYHPDVQGRVIEASREMILKMDPDAVVFVYYYAAAPEEPKEAYRKYFIEDSLLSRLTASQNSRFVAVPLTMSYASGILTIEGFELIARGLYPDLEL